MIGEKMLMKPIIGNAGKAGFGFPVPGEHASDRHIRRAPDIDVRQQALDFHRVRLVNGRLLAGIQLSDKYTKKSSTFRKSSSSRRSMAFSMNSRITTSSDKSMAVLDRETRV